MALRKSLLVFLCFNYFLTTAQVEYEPGYFIDESNNRVECLIRNEGWFRNPMKFTYKLNPSGEKLEAQIGSTKEFSVGAFRYFRETLEIDTSSQNLQRLSINSGPEWATRTVFLQLLVDGPARLYRYRTRELQLYFYSVNSSPIEQLVYKRYTISMTALSENFLFRSQVRGAVSCDETARTNAGRLKYEVDDLTRFFEEYNRCKGYIPPQDAQAGKHYKSKIRISVTPGYDLANISMVNDNASQYTSPQPDPGYRIGTMLEFVLPFQRNKWAFVVEPTYQGTFTPADETTHSSIETPIGVRHSFFLGQDISVFANLMMVIDLVFGYNCASPFNALPIGKLETEEVAGCVAVGAGLRWRFLSLEPRYYFNRRLTAENRWNLVDYSKTSFILGIGIPTGSTKK